MLDVGLLGGTFDPPHAAHVAMARAALASGLVDEVLVVPAGDPWQKQPGTAASDRLAMTRLAFAGEPHCSVIDLELQRAGATYTIDTVEALMRPDMRLHYIIGSDTLSLLPTWYRIAELAQRCDFLVVKRPGWTLNAPDVPGLQTQVVPADEWPETSTDLRAAIANSGQQPPSVADEVWDYILDHGLYGVGRD